MDQFTAGLRCQDVTLGVRELNPLDPALGTVRATHTVGMAADLAGLLRGREVVEGLDALTVVAAETLDIAPVALEPVLDLLEQAGLVTLRRQNGQIFEIFESIPIYQSLYDSLGAAWRERQPRQIEQELITVVDRLTKHPLPFESLTEDLGIDKSDIDPLYRLGVDTSIFKTVETVDGILLYSPYMAFENPGGMYAALQNHGSGQIAEALAKVSDYQGYPVNAQDEPILLDTIARGIIPAPAVQRPGLDLISFATMPYAFDRSLTRDRKPTLDKALAIVACVRCGEHFGGATNARDVVTVLGALRDREYLNPHSSHARQYKLLRDLGVIRFLPDIKPSRGWMRPSFLRTPENEEAMSIAIALLQGREYMSGRESDDGIKALLDLDARALKPLQSVAKTKVRNALPEADLAVAFNTLMSQGEL